MTSIEWTPQQLAFFSRLAETEDSILLSAVAGSGKTTTLCEGASRLRGSILAVAFNVRIKKVLEQRIGSIAMVKTLNGLGHAALVNMLGRVEIKADKLRAVSREILSRPENHSLWDCAAAATRLASRAKHSGLVPSGSPGLFKSLHDASEVGWEELATMHDIPFDQDVLALARQILKVSNELAWKRVCDFDDQLYLPICWGAAFPQFDNILVDEAQDLSEIQHRMLRKALRKNGRLIAVGDPDQAIYSWRGAKLNSLEALSCEFNLQSLDLTVSFRCAKRIVAEAQRLVSRLQAAPFAADGQVISLASYKASDFCDGDAILCRNNAPLIDLAYKLISCGKGVFVVGRDIGAGMKFLIRKLTNKDDSCSVERLTLVLENWRATSVTKAELNEQWSRIEGIEDKALSLKAVIERSGAVTAGGVIKEIERLFAKDSAPITLSTVHRAKGLEWDRVFFLDESLIPSKWAQRAAKRGVKWMLQEESNIYYVAVTRARKQLAYMQSKGWED